MVTTVARKTGVIARTVDDNLNSWSDFAGADINIDLFYQDVDPSIEEWDQQHWSYRGQAAVITLYNGWIVRCRIGSDSDPTDRKVYRQFITDPTDPDQWEAWSLVYSGSHYALAMEPDGTGYRIYTAKSDGIYMDNTLKKAVTGVVRIKTTYNTTGRLYYQVVGQDADGARVLDWYYTYIFSGAPSTIEDAANYRWYRSDLVVAQAEQAGFFYRFRAMAHDAAARSQYASQILTCETVWEDSFLAQEDYNVWLSPRYLKGPSARAGYKVIENLYLTRMYSPPLTEDAYYLFYNERHFDYQGNVLSNHKNPLFWSRSFGTPYYLSAPTPVGFTMWGFAGAVESGDYIYVCGNGRVLRRYKRETTLDISNYILEGRYSLPRDNQKSIGRLVCPNPGNVLGKQLGLTDADETGMTDHRFELAIGQQDVATQLYEYKREDSWWITRLRKTKQNEGEGVKQRLEIEIGNFWHRMENPFRDTISLPGHFIWDDWQPEAPNQLYNYSNDYDEFYASYPVGSPENNVPRLKAIVSASAPNDLTTLTLFAGWRGENGWISASLWADGGFVFRYVDIDNYYLVTVRSANDVRLIRRLGGIETTLASAALSGVSVPFFLDVDFRWKRIKVYARQVLRINHTLDQPEMLTGFVGITSPEISNLAISDWNEPTTTKEMMKTLLAYSDEHDVQLELDEETSSAAQIETTWGPQSDLDQPDKAFRQLLEASKLQAVWLEDAEVA